MEPNNQQSGIPDIQPDVEPTPPNTSAPMPQQEPVPLDISQEIPQHEVPSAEAPVEQQVAPTMMQKIMKDPVGWFKGLDQKKKALFLSGAGVVLLILLILFINIMMLIFGPKTPDLIGYDPNQQTNMLTPENGQYIIVRQRDTRGSFVEVRDLKNVAAPAELQFDANTYLPRETANYRILSYEWDLEGAGTFNDPQKTAIVTKTYIDRGIQNGQFNVSLRVMKEILAPHGEYQTPGAQVTEVYGPGQGGISFQITTVKPFVDVITTPQDLNGVAPFKVEFDASRSRAENEIDQYLWDFDGDSITDDEGPKVEHTFTRAGVETVTVEVIDIRNLSSKKSIKVIVDETVLPTPEIEASALTGDAPFKVTFDGSASTSKEGQIVAYNWTFREGVAAVSGKTAEYTFQDPGKYNVVLEVKTDLGAAAKKDVLITVNTSKAQPTARIRAEGVGGDGKQVIAAAARAPLRGRLPLTINFDASYSTDPNNSIVDWKWDFDGDQKFDTSGERVSHTFTKPGSYLATLRVENAAKLSSDDAVTIIVEAEDLTADIFADPISGTAPLTVAFDGSGSSYKNGSITSYEWNFGDGSRPRLTGAQTTYEFTAPGIYTVEMKVRTPDGQSKTATKIVTVLQEVLSPKFTATPKIGVAPLTVEMNASQSIGEIVSYRWDFGDGTSDTGIKVRKTYSVPGNYTVELKVYDKYGAMLSYKEEITVRTP